MKSITNPFQFLLAAAVSAWCGSGLVLDSAGVPLEAVKVTRKSDGATTTTNAAGQWFLYPPTNVTVHLQSVDRTDRRIVVEGGRLAFHPIAGRMVDGRRYEANGTKTFETAPIAARAEALNDSVIATAPGWTTASAVYDHTSSQNMIALRMAPSKGMVRIKGGFFTLGSAPQYNNLAHVVRLAGFWIDTTEVTQHLYDSIMGSNPSYHENCPTCPVEQVSWFDALRFCNARSRAEGLPEAYDLSSPDSMNWTWNSHSPGYRLPTDAEWEQAARAGSPDDWYWGQIVNTGTVIQYAWHDSNSGDSTHPVAQLKPNAFGLYDVSGNVTEWAWDVFKELNGDSLFFPKGPSSSVDRKCARGGDFSNFVVEIHSTRRLPALPTARWLALGFRTARGVMP